MSVKSNFVYVLTMWNPSISQVIIITNDIVNSSSPSYSSSSSSMTPWSLVKVIDIRGSCCTLQPRYQFRVLSHSNICDFFLLSLSLLSLSHSLSIYLYFSISLLFISVQTSHTTPACLGNDRRLIEVFSAIWPIKCSFA